MASLGDQNKVSVRPDGRSRRAIRLPGGKRAKTKSDRLRSFPCQCLFPFHFLPRAVAEGGQPNGLVGGEAAVRTGHRGIVKRAARQAGASPSQPAHAAAPAGARPTVPPQHGPWHGPQPERLQLNQPTLREI